MDPHAAQLNALLDEMLELEPEARGQWLMQLPSGLAALRPRLQHMLTLDARAGRLSTLPMPCAEPAARALQAPAHVGPYRLQRPLGSGGMASVWLAHDQRPGRSSPVALKLLHQAAPASGFAQRFAQEQRLLASLDHPNIVRLLDAGTMADGELYLTLEYVDGLPLDQHCARHALSLSRRFALLVQVADAVAHAHERQIVHRDLKPGNVLVDAQGAVRLLDFGVGKWLSEATAAGVELSTAFGRPVTPAYAAPEQLTGREVSYAADVYSLGVMAFELATGVRPFATATRGNPSLRDLLASPGAPLASSVTSCAATRSLLRGPIDATLQRALYRDPARRHPSMHALAAELEAHTRWLLNMQPRG